MPIQAKYNPYTDLYHTPQGKSLTLDEIEFLDSLERQWKRSLPKYNFYQLIKIFPEAKAAARVGLNAEIARCRVDLDEALRLEREYKKKIISKIPYDSEDFYYAVCEHLVVAPYRKGRETRIKKCRSYLAYLKVMDLPDSEKEKTINDIKVQQAKEIPIETFIDTDNSGFAHCFLHRDKTPSLKIYKNKNRWHCFSCDLGGDVIDLIMRRDNVNFIKAVKFLLKS